MKKDIIKFSIITLILGLIIGLIVGVSFFNKKINIEELNQPLINLGSLSSNLEDINTGLYGKYGFWKNHQVKKVDFLFEKKNVASNTFDRTISRTDCEEEFDTKGYPIEYIKKYTGNSQEGESVPNRFCQVDYVSADVVSGVNMDLSSRCVCWYTISAT